MSGGKVVGSGSGLANTFSRRNTIMRHPLPNCRRVFLAAALVAVTAGAAAANGFGTGNWGGSSIGVGPNTFYNNGLSSRQVGGYEFFNNGVVGMNYGNVTLYSNGLAARTSSPTSGHAPSRYFSNLSIGVPVRSGAGPRATVYGGGQPYPLGPGPNPFSSGAGGMPSGGATPWSTTPWSQKPW
jgi:hypothetical protein